MTRFLLCRYGLLDAGARCGDAGALFCGECGVGGGQAEEGEKEPPVADPVLVEWQQRFQGRRSGSAASAAASSGTPGGSPTSV